MYPRINHKQIELRGITSTSGNFRLDQIQTAFISFKPLLNFQGMRGYVKPVNGGSERYVFKADKDDWATTHTSGSIVIVMNAGDVFYVRSISGAGTIDYGPDAAFSGFLIN